MTTLLGGTRNHWPKHHVIKGPLVVGSELFGSAGACSYTGLSPQSSFQIEESIPDQILSNAFLIFSLLHVFTGKCP